MNRFHSPSRRTALVTLGALALSTVARAAPAAPRLAQPLERLRIGFQKSAVNLVLLKQQRTLETLLPDTRVTWNEFPAGPQLLEALAVGSVDVGLTGDTPPVFAQAAGKDVVYIGAEPPKPDSSAILVPPATSVRTLADLRGKRVALQKGSSSHYLLVRTIEEARLAWSDVEPVWLTPADARAAFERGSVDAWAIWDPYYAAAELQAPKGAAPRVLASGRGLSANNSFYLASRAFATRGDAIAVLFGALTDADRRVQDDRPGAAKLVAEFSGLELATVLRFIARRPPSPVTPLSDATVADQQRVADAFSRVGLLPKPVRVADVVWKPGPGWPARGVASLLPSIGPFA